jgi:hypothetical protein
VCTPGANPNDSQLIGIAYPVFSPLIFIGDNVLSSTLTCKILETDPKILT